MNEQVRELVARLNALESTFERSGYDLECGIEISEGDFGGQHVLISISSGAAIHIARQLLQLIERDFGGAHFDIDKANIATETDHQLCFSLKKPD